MKTPLQTRMARMPAQSEKKMLEDRIQKDKDFTSGRLSELARYIGFGAVAATFTLLSSNSAFALTISSSQNGLLTWSALSGMMTVMLDYFQYVMGYRASALASKSDDRKYQKKWLSYRTRTACFWLKQLSAMLSGLLLVTAILWSEMQDPHKSVVHPPVVVEKNAVSK